MSALACTTIEPMSAAALAHPLELPHPRPFVARMTIGSDSVNALVDHVANTQYVHWLDRVAELHCDSLGYTRSRMLADGHMWFVARHEIDYHAEARGGDQLIVATWVRTIERVKSWRETEFLRVRVGDEQRPAAWERIVSASTLWLYVDLARRRAVTIPPHVANPFEPLAVRPRRTDDACARATRP